MGCASNPNNRTQVDMDGPIPSETPEWVYAPDEACKDDIEICAAGEGETLEQADLRARKALAAVFETQINSKLDIYKTSFSDDEVSELQESVEMQVGETVDALLKSTTIEKRFGKNNLYFSLAILKKEHASEMLRAEIDSIDNELTHLYSQKRKSSIKRMIELLEKRAHIADKLLVVKGSLSKAPISFTQIQNIKFASSGFNKVFLNFEKDVPKTVAKQFQELMTSSGYMIRPDRAVDYVVDVKYESKETYLNVKGFKKFVFTIQFEGKNNVGEKVGSFTVTQVQTGRSERDAFLKARPKLQADIKKKLNLLNLK
tara:strand:- start:43224 stop:44168 length:945 start_codon:yes stop_codon:yes gene_type:complete